MCYLSNSFFFLNSSRLTVKVAGVLLRLQVRDELRLLPQQTVPVQIGEERVLLHLVRSSCQICKPQCSSILSCHYSLPFHSYVCPSPSAGFSHPSIVSYSSKGMDTMIDRYMYPPFIDLCIIISIHFIIHTSIIKSSIHYGIHVVVRYHSPTCMLAYDLFIHLFKASSCSYYYTIHRSSVHPSITSIHDCIHPLREVQPTCP